MRQQRRDAAQSQPGRQPFVHALAGRIERRVRTVHRDVRGDQVQQQSADGGVVGQPLRRHKRHGMMRDDQIGARFNRLGRAVGRDRQAGHQLLDALVTMAHQQADVVPLFGQSEGGNLFQKRGDGGDGGHGIF